MKRWNSCNVLEVGAGGRRLWQFDAQGAGFKLDREQFVKEGEPLPAGIINKNWRALWQPKLNVALLPPEKVFFRVAQLPPADHAEMLSMVELQLEKLSPLPVNQIVWTVHEMPAGASAAPVAEPKEGEAAQPALRTVIVTVAERSAIEEFLGTLENDGFLADRIEVPMLDKLQATAMTQDGAWVYPDASGEGTALLAWCYGGSLQSLGLLRVPAGENRAALLKEQINPMIWAGEFEGWLTSAPRWHLVADQGEADRWQPLLHEALGEAIEVLPPPPAASLAAATARRAAGADEKDGLLPAEHVVRYRQQFVDRLWMRGLFAIGAFYCVCVGIYFVALNVLLFRVNRVEGRVTEIAVNYTNAIQIREKFQILQDRQELKYAALDCWKATAELMPESITLQGLDFSGGKKLQLNGTVGKESISDVIDFNSALKKATVNGQPLFAKIESPTYTTDAGGTASWRFSCEINRAEAK